MDSSAKASARLGEGGARRRKGKVRTVIEGDAEILKRPSRARTKERRGWGRREREGERSGKGEGRETGTGSDEKGLEEEEVGVKREKGWQG